MRYSLDSSWQGAEVLGLVKAKLRGPRRFRGTPIKEEARHLRQPRRHEVAEE